MRYLDGEGTLTKDIEGDFNVESDCEGDSTGVTLEEEKREEGGSSVLVVGSFSAYVSFLLSPSRIEKRPVLQLEVPFLLSLHGRNLVRSPQIARCRLSSRRRYPLVRPPKTTSCRLSQEGPRLLVCSPRRCHPLFESRSRRDRNRCTPSLLTEEHLRSGKLSEAAFDWSPLTWR